VELDLLEYENLFIIELLSPLKIINNL
jgi:hypothetical protein